MQESANKEEHNRNGLSDRHNQARIEHNLLCDNKTIHQIVLKVIEIEVPAKIPEKRVPKGNDRKNNSVPLSVGRIFIISLRFTVEVAVTADVTVSIVP